MRAPDSDPADTHPSPSGDYLLTTAATETRMSHWVYAPAITETRTGATLMRLGGSAWSASEIAWRGDDVVTMALRRYPDGGTVYRLAVDCRQRSFMLGREAGPLTRLDTALERAAR